MLCCLHLLCVTTGTVQDALSWACFRSHFISMHTSTWTSPPPAHTHTHAPTVSSSQLHTHTCTHSLFLPSVRMCVYLLQVVGRTKLLPAAAGKGPRLPVAHMVCNQSPPVDGQPSLMTFRWDITHDSPLCLCGGGLAKWRARAQEGGGREGCRGRGEDTLSGRPR